MEEKGAVYLLGGLLQVGLGHQPGEPLQAGRGDGLLCLPAPLKAAKGGCTGVGHGVVGLEN